MPALCLRERTDRRRTRTAAPTPSPTGPLHRACPCSLEDQRSIHSLYSFCPTRTERTLTDPVAHCKDTKAVLDSRNPAAWLNFHTWCAFPVTRCISRLLTGDSSVTFRHQSFTDCSAAPCLLSAGHCCNRDIPFDRHVLFHSQTRVVKPVSSRGHAECAVLRGFPLVAVPLPDVTQQVLNRPCSPRLDKTISRGCSFFFFLFSYSGSMIHLPK